MERDFTDFIFKSADSNDDKFLIFLRFLKNGIYIYIMLKYFHYLLDKIHFYTYVINFLLINLKKGKQSW